MFVSQEVVGNLVTHIGSGFPAEIESSLDILLDLVMQHNAMMAPFAIFIKVLDFQIIISFLSFITNSFGD